MAKTHFSEGIPLKKQFGQHFLRSSAIVDTIIQAVELDKQSSVFEIGCGDGFLTKRILQESIARLWVFEIDHQWAHYVKNHLQDARLTVFEQNFLDTSGSFFKDHQPWTLLANLPYQVTFPILHWLADHHALLKEGVIMVQEEVAQKIVKTRGKGYGFVSLFFQHFFSWKLLSKVAPQDFFPAPKVYSRLLYFKPRENRPIIPQEAQFWKFLKICFQQPRRTLRNNLLPLYAIDGIPDKILNLRAQQMDMQELLSLWDMLRHTKV